MYDNFHFSDSLFCETKCKLQKNLHKKMKIKLCNVCINNIIINNIITIMWCILLEICLVQTDTCHKVAFFIIIVIVQFLIRMFCTITDGPSVSLEYLMVRFTKLKMSRHQYWSIWKRSHEDISTSGKETFFACQHKKFKRPKNLPIKSVIFSLSHNSRKWDFVDKPSKSFEMLLT